MTRDFAKGPLWATPEKVAQGIVRAIERGAHEVYLPGFWRLIMTVIRTIPERIFLRTRL
jgi:short-subunit dehydrogenase